MGMKSSKKAVDPPKVVQLTDQKDPLTKPKDNSEQEANQQMNEEDKEEDGEEEDDNTANININDNYYLYENDKLHESASCSSDIDIKQELMQYKQSLVTLNTDTKGCKFERDTYRSNSFSLSKNTLTLIENELLLDKCSFSEEKIDLNKERLIDNTSINITNHHHYDSKDQLKTEADSNDKTNYKLKVLNKEGELKSSYISKLICSKLCEPKSITKESTLIIFDWDDTLLCTTFLTPNGEFDSDKTYNNSDEEKIAKIEQGVLKLLTQAVDKGETYIITNSVPGWVEYSANRFYPRVQPVLAKITIISARGEYEEMFPGNSSMWKLKAFQDMQKKIDVNVKSNIICIGDSFIEVEAAKALKANFSKANIKSVKFRAAPKLEELNKQLSLLSDHLNDILSSNKSVIMTVEKRQRRQMNGEGNDSKANKV